MFKAIISPEKVFSEGKNISSRSAAIIHVCIYLFATLINFLGALPLYGSKPAQLIFITVSPLIFALVFWTIYTLLVKFVLNLDASLLSNFKLAIKAMLPFNFWSSFIVTLLSIPTLIMSFFILQNADNLVGKGTDISSSELLSFGASSIIVALLSCIILFFQLFAIWRLFKATKSIFTIVYKPSNDITVKVILVLVGTFIITFTINLILNIISSFIFGFSLIQ
jgi:hypothetical protein